MEKYNPFSNIIDYGFFVSTFPGSIRDAFEILIQKTGDCAGFRNYYGFSEFKDRKIVYYVVAEEKSPGGTEKYNYNKFSIEKGDYVTITVSDWQKTNCSKDVFSEIIQHPRANKINPPTEWHKGKDEMVCLIQMND